MLYSLKTLAGDQSFQVLVNHTGVAGFVVFKKGDKAVTPRTAQPDGEELARRVAGTCAKGPAPPAAEEAIR